MISVESLRRVSSFPLTTHRGGEGEETTTVRVCTHTHTQQAQFARAKQQQLETPHQQAQFARAKQQQLETPHQLHLRAQGGKDTQFSYEITSPSLSNEQSIRLPPYT